ncbi:hypothetical protein AAVH_04659 [Aphelenchoides avenae]|nr:hypothetical protein AAVH_04659 [Aphelenchus avenae]
MSSKTPTAIKPSIATTVKPSTVLKTPTLPKTSATTKTPTKTPASERAASFVTPRTSGARPTSSSSSSSEGSGTPTYYRKRGAELGVECLSQTHTPKKLKITP